jgi:peptide/nickel transport system substrate-binding protein
MISAGNLRMLGLGCLGVALAITMPLSLAQPASMPAQRGGTLHLALGEDPDTLDPHATVSLTSSQVQSLIYSPLVYIQSNGLPAPLAAQSWTISPDGRAVTFKLRPGLKFSDGTPFDAQAVEYTFHRHMDPATASPSTNQLGPLQSVKALNTLAVRFTFKEPYAPFFTSLAGSYLSIMSPAAARKLGKGLGHNPVGVSAGPFVFKSWTPGSEIVLIRNPNYQLGPYRNDTQNKGLPYVDELDLKVVPEVGTRIAALETGALDISALTLEAVPRFLNNPRFQVITKKDANDLVFIEFDYKRPPFNDPKFRTALGWAVDKQAIVRSAWGGYATPNLTPMPVGDAGYDPKIGEQYGIGYDPKKAAQLFDEMGWKLNPQTKVREKDSHAAKFTCWTYSGFETVKRGCEVIQANLKDVGIDVAVTLTDFGTMSGQMPKAQFDFDLMRWTYPDPTILSLLFKTPGWVKLYSDPALDVALNRADATLDPVKRVQYVKAAEVMILQKAVIVPILTDWLITGARAQVQGLHLDHFGGILYQDIWLKP